MPSLTPLFILIYRKLIDKARKLCDKSTLPTGTSSPPFSDKYMAWNVTKICRSDSPLRVVLSDKPPTEGFTLLVSHNRKKNTYGGVRDWKKKDNLLSNSLQICTLWSHNVGNEQILPQPSWGTGDIVRIFSDADSSTSYYCYVTDPFKQKVSDVLKDYRWTWSLPPHFCSPGDLILLKKERRTPFHPKV